MQAICSDGSTTNVAMLPQAQPGYTCPFNYTMGKTVNVKSDSTPPAFWNTYYRQACSHKVPLLCACRRAKISSVQG